METQLVKLDQKEDNDFLTMIKEGDVEGVKAMIAPNQVNLWNTKGGNNAFHVAAECTDAKMVKLLAGYVSDPSLNWISTTVLNAHDASGNTPLFCAFKKRHLEHFQILLGAGADINRPNSRSRTLLHCAVFVQDVAMITFLLDNDAALEVADWEGYTALHLAIYAAKDISIVQLLLLKGASINAGIYNGETPLHLAIGCNNLNIFQMLLCKGASMCADKNNNLPLHKAVYQGRVAIVQEILKLSCDSINTLNGEGMSPLHLASQRGCITTIRLLLSFGASVNLRSTDGKTALSYASMYSICTINIKDVLMSCGGTI